MKLKSKRNYVEKLDIDGCSIVRKHFYSMDDWRNELENHAFAGKTTPAAAIRAAVPGLIVSDYLPYPHLLDVLEMQEKLGFAPFVWERLAAWLNEIAAKSTALPAEGNLRNFLWNENGGEVFPVDLEHWRVIPFVTCAAGIIAFLLEYEPAGSSVKCSAAEVLSKEWGIKEENISAERRKLRERRGKRVQQKQEPFSLILLAGGQSARMGVNKAKMDLFGKTMLEHQLETAYMLGTDDVLISGAPEYTGIGSSVADEHPCRGPLGGIYSCMKRAKHEKCVVLGVDMPAVTAGMLNELVFRHKAGDGITLAAHEGMVEPLAGVYDTALCGKIGELIAQKGVSVRRLMQESCVHCVDFQHNPAIWHNCNTPGEFKLFTEGELTQSMLKNT